jgi:hypothetical protein
LAVFHGIQNILFINKSEAQTTNLVKNGRIWHRIRHYTNSAPEYNSHNASGMVPSVGRDEVVHDGLTVAVLHDLMFLLLNRSDMKQGKHVCFCGAGKGNLVSFPYRNVKTLLPPSAR